MNAGFRDMPVEVPCGTCIGCREARGAEWALRCVHESKMHTSNWFATLTYKDVPDKGSLRKVDWQRFMYRLRDAVGPVRFFMCGQYGSVTFRPHYHALFFGLRLDDVRLYGSSKRDDKALYVSAMLERLWGHGEVKLAAVTPGSVRYVTAYMGRSVLDAERCDMLGIEPEFQLMSRRPGIGKPWLDSFGSDVYPDGYVTLKGGVKARAPRYYDKLVERIAPGVMRQVRASRRAGASKDVDGTPRRLVVRETVANRRVSFFGGSDPD